MNLSIGLSLTRPSGPLGFNPASLFASGEVGAWYDPSDSTTVFQDAAGTTPAGVGDPVGLILDKSKGLTLGSELVTNGTFDAWSSDNPDGWTVGGENANNYITESISGARIVSDNSSALYMSQVLTVESGSLIRVAITKSNHVSGSIRLQISGVAAFTIANIAGSDQNGTFDISVGVSTSTSITLYIWRDNTTNTDYVIDNISIRELPGNHATQSTSTARPTLQVSGGLYYLDFDGVDDGMTTAAVDFSVTENATLFAAVNKRTEPANQTIVELGLTTSSQGMFTLTGKSGLAKYAAGSRGTALGLATTSDAAFAAPSKNIVSGLVSITGNLAELRIDGASVAVDNTDQGDRAYLNAALNIMARDNASANWFDGHLYGLIIRGASSTIAEIEDAETYLAAKSGVTL